MPQRCDTCIRVCVRATLLLGACCSTSSSLTPLRNAHNSHTTHKTHTARQAIDVQRSLQLTPPAAASCGTVNLVGLADDGAVDLASWRSFPPGPNMNNQAWGDVYVSCYNGAAKCNYAQCQAATASCQTAGYYTDGGRALLGACWVRKRVWLCASDRHARAQNCMQGAPRDAQTHPHTQTHTLHPQSRAPAR